MQTTKLVFRFFLTTKKQNEIIEEILKSIFKEGMYFYG